MVFRTDDSDGIIASTNHMVGIHENLPIELGFQLVQSLQITVSLCLGLTDVVAVVVVAKDGIDTVVCLECGAKFKMLTKRHLALHGLTPAEYKAKWGLKKSSSLACKSLQRMRRKKMQDMQLWSRRKNFKGNAGMEGAESFEGDAVSMEGAE